MSYIIHAVSPNWTTTDTFICKLDRAERHLVLHPISCVDV